MKVNFDVVLKDLDGQPIVELDAKKNELPVTLKLIAVRALTGMLEEDRSMTGEQSFKRLELARKVHAGGEGELDPADAVLIRDRTAKFYGPLVSGQVYELLK